MENMGLLITLLLVVIGVCGVAIPYGIKSLFGDDFQPGFFAGTFWGVAISWWFEFKNELRD